MNVLKAIFKCNGICPFNLTKESSQEIQIIENEANNGENDLNRTSKINIFLTKRISRIKSKPKIDNFRLSTLGNEEDNSEVKKFNENSNEDNLLKLNSASQDLNRDENRNETSRNVNKMIENDKITTQINLSETHQGSPIKILKRKFEKIKKEINQRETKLSCTGISGVQEKSKISKSQAKSIYHKSIKENANSCGRKRKLISLKFNTKSQFQNDENSINRASDDGGNEEDPKILQLKEKKDFNNKLIPSENSNFSYELSFYKPEKTSKLDADLATALAQISLIRRKSSNTLSNSASSSYIGSISERTNLEKFYIKNSNYQQKGNKEQLNI